MPGQQTDGDTARTTDFSLPGITRVGRQGIFDVESRVIGYELLFRGYSSDEAKLPDSSPDANALDAHDHATSQVISATFGVFGIQDLSGGLPLFLNMTRWFLTGDVTLPFSPDGVVLEILEGVTPDAELLAAVQKLKEQGYSIAVDDFDGDEARVPLLQYADYIKIDIVDVWDTLDNVIALCRDAAPHAVLVAERVETLSQFQRCVTSGFDHFQGYYFEKPQLMEQQQLSPSQMVCLKLVNTLSTENPDPRQIEQIVAADPSLALRVMRTANSVGSGTMHRVTSIRQALVLIGPKSLSTWVMLTLMGGAAQMQQYQVTDILVHAGVFERVATERGLEPTEAYTIGMMYGIAAQMGYRIEAVANSAGLAPDLVAAISNPESNYGKLNAEIEAYNVAIEDVSLESSALTQAVLESWSGALKMARRTFGR